MRILSWNYSFCYSCFYSLLLFLWLPEYDVSNRDKWNAYVYYKRYVSRLIKYIGMNNHSNEDFINVLHFSSSNQQGSVDNELLKAQVYLAKADKGDRWWYSLAIIFVQLPEGDERIEFVKKYLSDKMFGKSFSLHISWAKPARRKKMLA